MNPAHVLSARYPKKNNEKKQIDKYEKYYNSGSHLFLKS